MEESNAAIVGIVSSWLVKRGYNKTNEALKKDLSLNEYVSERLNDESVANFVLFHENVANVGARYAESFSALREWVDKSLDRYKYATIAVLPCVELTFSSAGCDLCCSLRFDLNCVSDWFTAHKVRFPLE